MSTTGDPRLPGPTREAMRILLASPPKTREEFLSRYSVTWNLLRAGSFPEDEAMDQQRAERTWIRGNDPAGSARQLRAIFASGDRAPRHGERANDLRAYSGRKAGDVPENGPRNADLDVARDHRRDRNPRAGRSSASVSAIASVRTGRRPGARNASGPSRLPRTDLEPPLTPGAGGRARRRRARAPPA